MKRLLFIIFLIFAFEVSFSQYNDTSLNGPWIWGNLSYPEDSINYIIFDGAGHITDLSCFGYFLQGNYSVSADGAITGSLFTHPLTGQLTSSTTGTLIMVGFFSYSLLKISNPGAMSDSLIGLLDSNPGICSSCGQKNIKLTLNSQGQITSASGLTPPVSGKVFAESGLFVGHIKTGETAICGGTAGKWGEFGIQGTYSGDSLTGILQLDGPGICRGNSFLIRKNSSAGIYANNFSSTTPEIYPNPAIDIITLNINNSNFEDLTIKIYNITGTLLKVEKLTQNQRQINVEDLSNGIYLIKIESNYLTGSQKLIIQR